MTTITFLRGCQCSGKSTYIENIFSNIKDYKSRDLYEDIGYRAIFASTCAYFHISKDMIREHYFGKEYLPDNKKERLIVDSMFRQIIIDLAQQAKENHNKNNIHIYIDNMNLSEDSMNEVKDIMSILCDSECYEYKEVIMPLPSFAVIVERNRKRKRDTGKTITASSMQSSYLAHERLINLQNQIN